MATATAGSIRAELFGATTRAPAFALLLPAGWVAQPADGTAVAGRLRDAARRIPGADRARFGASIEALISQLNGTAAANDERMIATITQSGSDPEAFVPMSMALAWVQAPAGSRIVSLASQLVADRGAAPLDEAGAIFRWIDRVTTPLDDVEVHTVQPTYLIRVPSGADTALIIRATILDGVAEQRLGDEQLAGMTALSDGIVSTFRWRRDG